MGAVVGRHLAGCCQKREAHVVEHGLLRKQAEVLEDHGHAATVAAQFGAGEARHVLTVDDDLARRGALQQVDAAHERRLAGAAHADDPRDIAIGDIEGDVIQSARGALSAVKHFAQMLDLYHENTTR